MKTYPDEITNSDAQWLAFCADDETGWLEREPHEPEPPPPEIDYYQCALDILRSVA